MKGWVWRGGVAGCEWGEGRFWGCKGSFDRYTQRHKDIKRQRHKQDRDTIYSERHKETKRQRDKDTNHDTQREEHT